MVHGLIGIITGFANGLFGSGGGTIVVSALEKFLDVKAHKAHATAILIILPLSILSAVIYIRGVEADFKTIFFVSAGGVLGGFLGARTLNKIPAKRLHKIFGLFMIVAAVRMIL